jgi:hypothetical protein
MALAAGLPEELEAAPPPVVWDDARLDDVCGRYASAEGNNIRVSRGGEGFLVDVDGAMTTAYPINRYMLWVRGMVTGMTVSLYRGDDGRVWGLNGGYRVIPKIPE